MMKANVMDDTQTPDTVNNIYPNKVKQGFWGANKEGKLVLSIMGLKLQELPFDLDAFLCHKETYWKDKWGNIAYISFQFNENHIECFGSYLGRKKSILVERLENMDKYGNVSKTDSEQIGFNCMQCVYSLLPQRYKTIKNYKYE